MREDTKVTKVYRFEELSDEAQQKVLEKLADVNVDYEWWDSVYEDAARVGVRIESFDLSRGAFRSRGRFTEDELTVAENILKEHGKDCETYKDAYEFVWTMAQAVDADYELTRDEAAYAESNFEWCSEEFDPSAECPDELEEFRRTIFEDYRSILQNEYDYLTSEEAIKETIDANEYEFTEDGRIYS